MSALFGEGDDARRTLISAWLDEGRAEMHNSPTTTIKDVLGTRLRYNEPVLDLLPEVQSLIYHIMTARIVLIQEISRRLLFLLPRLVASTY